MILLQSDREDKGFGVRYIIESYDAGDELAAILKTIERDHPQILAQALDYLIAGKMEVDK